MIITSSDLTAFADEVDSLGGPGHADAMAYWADFTYVPTVTVDTTLDPDSAEYHAQMLALYEEISGRQLDQKSTELTNLSIEALVDAESPYTSQTPTQRAMHYLRLAKAVQTADLPSGARVLDMGCGWGLSSELLAQLGFKVSAIDINPSFVQLVQRRAKRLGLDIAVRQAAFEDSFDGGETFDAVMFYECFHHAVDPNALLAHISASLTHGGKLILAGEPIQALWWPYWGLRLDALSVYCIHRYGWFESGWSEVYLKRILAANDLIPVFSNDPDPGIGTYVIACNSWSLQRREIEGLLTAGDWWLEGDKAISNRNGTDHSALTLHKPKNADTVVFEMWNFTNRELCVSIEMGTERERLTLLRGRNDVVLSWPQGSAMVQCVFSCVPWSPGATLGNGDERLLGFHLKAITYRTRAGIDGVERQPVRR